MTRSALGPEPARRAPSRSPWGEETALARPYLQREGKVDQAKGRAKDAVDDAGEKVKDVVDRDRD